MYTALLHTHSTLRYLMLILLLATVTKALAGHFGNKAYTETDRKLGLYTLITTHLQLLVGLTLYFVSPMISGAMEDMGATMKNAELRFYVIEHLSVMLLGIIMITIGYSRVKRTTDVTKKSLRTAIFYGIGLLLVLLRMPYDRW